MKTEYTGVISNGGVSFDTPLTLPEKTRVVVRVVECEKQAEHTTDEIQGIQQPDSAEIERIRQAEAVREFLEAVRQTPMHLGGKRFNRDELYDRH